MNQFMIVGKLEKDVETTNFPNDDKVGYINVVVARPYKNSEGQYENDIVKVKLLGSIVENTAQYCKKGDVIGVKGRIQSKEYTNEMELVADKLTFLSSAKED